MDRSPNNRKQTPASGVKHGLIVTSSDVPWGIADFFCS
jgi:hypothetical protein